MSLHAPYNKFTETGNYKKNPDTQKESKQNVKKVINKTKIKTNRTNALFSKHF